jgi:hypothetical protein
MENGSVTGCVRNLAGEPVCEASVLITGKSPIHRDLAAVTNDLGCYTLHDLVPGIYDITVYAEGLARDTRHVSICPGQCSKLNFILCP